MQISSSRFCFHKTEWVSNTYWNRHNCNLDLNIYNLYINIYFLHCQLLLLWAPLWHDAAETQTHRKWSNPFPWHSLRHNSWSWGEASVAPHLSRNRHSSRSSKQAPVYILCTFLSCCSKQVFSSILSERNPFRHPNLTILTCAKILFFSSPTISIVVKFFNCLLRSEFMKVHIIHLTFK